MHRYPNGLPARRYDTGSGGTLEDGTEWSVWPGRKGKGPEDRVLHVRAAGPVRFPTIALIAAVIGENEDRVYPYGRGAAMTLELLAHAVEHGHDSAIREHVARWTLP